jgi:hypothetical protein
MSAIHDTDCDEYGVDSKALAEVAKAPNHMADALQFVAEVMRRESLDVSYNSITVGDGVVKVSLSSGDFDKVFKGMIADVDITNEKAAINRYGIRWEKIIWKSDFKNLLPVQMIV